MRSAIVLSVLIAASLAVNITPSMVMKGMMHPKGYKPSRSMNPLSDSIDSRVSPRPVTLSLRYLRQRVRGYAVCLYSFYSVVDD